MIKATLKNIDSIIMFCKKEFDIDLIKYINEQNIKDIYRKIIYLYNNDHIINEHMMTNIVQIYNDIKYQNVIKGQEKRKLKLISSGYYSDFIMTINNESNCKHCGITYIIKNNVSNKNGFCNLECYKNSGHMLLNLKKTYLINKKINIENLTTNSINELYSEYKRYEVLQSQPLRVNTIKNNYINGFSDICKKGNKNKKIKFLLKNNLIKNDEQYSECYIDALYLKHFNIISKHGEKIKKSILEKHGDNINNILKNQLLNFHKKILIEKNINIENINDNDIKKLYNKYIKTEKNIKKWKLTTVINNGDNESDIIKNISFDDVDLLYSEYLSNRNKKLIDNVYNGYKKTKKGWYIFENIDRKFFYRSSWEEYILIIIDKLIKDNIIKDVNIPYRIKYFYKYKRHYYPDIFIKYTDGDFKIIEIKPQNKLNDEININKFNEAFNLYKDNFIILTEYNIFKTNIIEEFKNKFIKTTKNN